MSASVSETMRVQRCVLLHAGSAHTCGCCSVGQIGFSFFVDILVRTLTVPWFFTSCSRAARAPVGFHTCRSTGCRVCPVNVHMHTLSALTCSPHQRDWHPRAVPTGHGATRGSEGDARVGPPLHTSHRPRSWPCSPALPVLNTPPPAGGRVLLHVPPTATRPLGRTRRGP